MTGQRVAIAPELWLRILGFLAVYPDNEPLKAASLVCHLFRDFTIPYLFSKLIVKLNGTPADKIKGPHALTFYTSSQISRYLQVVAFVGEAVEALQPNIAACRLRDEKVFRQLTDNMTQLSSLCQVALWGMQISIVDLKSLRSISRITFVMCTSHAEHSRMRIPQLRCTHFKVVERDTDTAMLSILNIVNLDPTRLKLLNLELYSGMDRLSSLFSQVYPKLTTLHFTDSRSPMTWYPLRSEFANIFAQSPILEDLGWGGTGLLEVNPANESPLPLPQSLQYYHNLGRCFKLQQHFLPSGRLQHFGIQFSWVGQLQDLFKDEAEVFAHLSSLCLLAEHNSGWDLQLREFIPNFNDVCPNYRGLCVQFWPPSYTDLEGVDPLMVCKPVF